MKTPMVSSATSFQRLQTSLQSPMPRLPRSNVYSTRDPANPSASVHRKRFFTPSLTLKFLCAGYLNSGGGQHVDGQAARRGSRRGRKAEIYGRIDGGRRVCAVVDALPDPCTVANQCCVTCRGQRKKCACTDQCRQQQ